MEFSTGSRGLISIQRATVLRLLIGAVVMFGLVALSATFAANTSAGGVPGKVTVNSTGNTNDGRCNGPPNDTTVGNCTLREAIDQVNLGTATLINFHPTIFPHATSDGTIQLELGDGPLPPIFREVFIDATNVKVILDGDFDNDGIGVPWGIVVIPTHNGFDFKLDGGGNTFIIKDVGCDLSLRQSPCNQFLGGDGEAISGPNGKLGLLEGVGVIIGNFCDTINGQAVSGAGFCNCTDGSSVQGFVCGTGGQGAGDGDAAGPVAIGGPFSLGDVIINGIEVHNAMDSAGIFIEATNINNAMITDSWIEADLDGIHIDVFSPPAAPDGLLVNNNVHINGNTISGGQGLFIAGESTDASVSGGGPFIGNGVSVNFCCNLGSKLTADVSNNDSIVGNFGNGVWLNYCLGSGCYAESGSAFNFTVNGNGKISGSNDAVNIGVFPDGSADAQLPAQGSDINVDVKVNGNDTMDGEFDDGTDVTVDICCANSDSDATVAVNDNLDIVGDDHAVDIDQTVCCGDGNESHTSVNSNNELVGEGDEGVDINTHAGGFATDVDSDSNINTVEVSTNQNISGDDNDGVSIDASSGKEDGGGDADRNRTEITVHDNNDVSGDDDGIDVEARAGTDGGPGDADDNDVIVRITGNDDTTGADDEGFDVDVTAGADRFGADNTTGDGNSTDVLIDQNDDVKGMDGAGVDVRSFAGGASDTGEGNSTKTVVTNNDDITGHQGSGDGVHTENAVCCDVDGGNTNEVDINGNDNIIGEDADGIDVHELCCTFNTLNIVGNDNIKGNDEQGIEVTPCLGTGDAQVPGDVDLDDVTCMGESVTIANISDNNVSNSGMDGILICCGVFQFPTNQAPAGSAGAAAKSVIADNVISHNGEDGIDLDTTIGFNVRHNQIFSNGTSATDGDNGVEIDWQFAYQIWEGANDIDAGTVKIPAHFNRITENSIYDNAGLGINLIGDVSSLGVAIYAPGSGTENGNLTDGVGCIQYDETPIAANDCIPYPKLLFTGGPSVSTITGTACASCLIEIFIADPSPADQTGPLGRQHGEGRTYLINVETDALGNFTVDLPCGLSGSDLTATATDKLKNTSEFSSNIPFPGTQPCAVDTATPAPATNTPVAPTATPVGPTNTPPPPPTATATTGPSKACGDVNDDGLVNSVDAELILQLKAALINSLPNEPSGDVNDNGQLTSVDAALILQKTAGLIPASALTCP